MSDMKRIGYWFSPQEPHLPVPQRDTDNLSDYRRRVVADYLRTATVVSRYKGFSLCRICGIVNGSTDRSDGTYIWPDGLVHYVTIHHVALPMAFVQHVFKQRVSKQWRTQE